MPTERRITAQAAKGWKGRIKWASRADGVHAYRRLIFLVIMCPFGVALSATKLTVAVWEGCRNRWCGCRDDEGPSEPGAHRLAKMLHHEPDGEIGPEGVIMAAPQAM